MGVGDVGEVSGRARGWIDTAGGDDGRGEGRERDTGVVGGWGRVERDASGEPGGVRVGVDDGAWGRHGAGEGDGSHEVGAYGMRGNSLGVGDVSEVHGGARKAGHSTGRRFSSRCCR